MQVTAYRDPMREFSPATARVNTAGIGPHRKLSARQACRRQEIVATVIIGRRPAVNLLSFHLNFSISDLDHGICAAPDRWIVRDKENLVKSTDSQGTP